MTKKMIDLRSLVYIVLFSRNSTAAYFPLPEADSIIAVCQMLRQRQAEALREAGQMVLL